MTRGVAETAAAQLRRVLHLVPLLADDREHPIDEVAEAVGVGRKELLKDLRSLADRFDDPGGFVEGVAIYIDGDRVSVQSSHFLRPMRLTRTELAALELGLAMLRSERSPEEHRAIDGARRHLSNVLAGTPDDAPELRAADSGYPHHDDSGRRRVIRSAIRDRRKVRITYQKANEGVAEPRTVCPYSLVLARGMWYLVAHCESGEGLRFFRLDRVTGAEPADEKFRMPTGFSVEQLMEDGRMFHSEAAEQLVIRYSPRIARWIAERQGASPDADGSLTLTHPMADEGWAVRHVLQYGPDAEVLSPESVREAVRGRLTAMVVPRS